VEQLLTAQERERTEIARELHDQAGQALSSLLVGLKSLRKMDDDESDRHIDTLRATTGRVLDEVRTLSFALRPPSLDEFGLVAALERDMEVMQKQGDVRLDFVADETVPSELPDDVEIAVYRVVHAALTNARQHARAENVSVLLRVRGALLHVIVDDDGVGFDVESVLDGPVEGRFGLLAMQERLRPVAGSVEFESAPGAGSTVFIRVPTGPDTPSGDSAR
jgi:signal transduction histidine kinase